MTVRVQRNACSGSSAAPRGERAAGLRWAMTLNEIVADAQLDELLAGAVPPRQSQPGTLIAAQLRLDYAGPAPGDEPDTGERCFYERDFLGLSGATVLLTGDRALPVPTFASICLSPGSSYAGWVFLSVADNASAPVLQFGTGQFDTRAIALRR